MKSADCAEWPRGGGRSARAGTAALAGVLSLLIVSPAAAQYYIGPSYLKVPGADGGPKNPPSYRGWVRAEANYWTQRPPRRNHRSYVKQSSLTFTPSQAPQKGPNVLSLAIAKNNPALPSLMETCRSGQKLPLLTYAESAEMMRHPSEDGPRPADIPAFYEYELKNVGLTCPVVADAPEQAFQLHFDEIAWLNTRPEPQPREVTATPAKLSPVTEKGARKVFVVHWISLVSDSRTDQCPTMNSKPSEADYYALMSPERAAEQRAALASKGGVTPVEFPYRGPDEMNVVLLPGIVADPGFFEPNVDVVQGFDLDGDDGAGKPPPGTRKHKNYVSPDGRRGIDNQLFAIEGCVAGLRRDGVRPMLTNESRRVGGKISVLIEISGIDDERNDDDVAVTVLYSTDQMRRDGRSKGVLPDFTFRVNETPEFSKDFTRFKGRIVDGVVMTDPVNTMHLRLSGVWEAATLANARLRIEFKPDGAMAAFLGGYLDWRAYVADAFWNSSTYETIVGFSIPGMYNAVRRAADGLKDPVTGEFNGISAVYALDGVPAFIPPAQDRALLAGKIADPAKDGDRVQVSLSSSERPASQ
jgi:hypothetical protein